MQADSLIFSPNDWTEIILFSISTTLFSVDIQVLVSLWMHDFSKGHGNDSIKWSWERLPYGLFGLFIPVNQQAEKWVVVLNKVPNSHFQIELGLLLHNGHKEMYV